MKSNLLFGSINIVLKMKVLPWPLMWWRTLVAVTMFFISFFCVFLYVFVFVWSVFEELARGTPLVITDAGGGDTLCGDWNNTRNKNNTRNYTRRRWSEITVNSLQYWGKKPAATSKHMHMKCSDIYVFSKVLWVQLFDANITTPTPPNVTRERVRWVSI